MATKCICANCGCVNILDQPVPEVGEEWLGCVLPTGFEWTLPAGKITPVAGPVSYVDAFGNHLSYEAFLKKYNIDPEIAYQNMRGKTAPKPLKLGKY